MAVNSAPAEVVIGSPHCPGPTAGQFMLALLEERGRSLRSWPLSRFEVSTKPGVTVPHLPRPMY